MREGVGWLSFEAAVVVLLREACWLRGGVLAALASAMPARCAAAAVSADVCRLYRCVARRREKGVVKGGALEARDRLKNSLTDRDLCKYASGS